MDSGFFPERTNLGRYRVLKRLGDSASSEVLLAISQGPHGFERLVVIKRLLPRHSSDTSMGQRLAKEAVAYARLTHPAIVRLYDFFDLEGEAILVLEYVDGPSLESLQATLAARRETLSDPIALYIASRVFAALAAAHAARDPRSGEFAPVIHRGVSPGNVILPWDGFVKLGDFGFAKVKGLTGDTSDTHRGLFKGTLGYMAPEQVLGEPVTARTDVYAGCLLLRELLLARPAFPRDVPELEALRAMAEAELPPIETLRGGLSPAFVDAMRRGFARDPEARSLTAAEMVRVLRQETDLVRAQVALEATLARTRPNESRASTPPHGIAAVDDAAPSGTMRFERMHLPPEAMPSTSMLAGAGDSDAYPAVRHDTPHAVVLKERSDAAPQVDTWTPAMRRPRRALFALGLAGIAACVALGIGARVRSAGHEEHETAAPPASVVTTKAIVPSPSSPPPDPPPVAPPPVAAPPGPPPASTVGELSTPSRARSHRVFVDGRYAAPQSGVTLELRCGAHTVRIGSRGREQAITVPCGGSIAVDAP